MVLSVASATDAGSAGAPGKKVPCWVFRTSIFSTWLHVLALVKASSDLVITSCWSIVIVHSGKLSITPKLRRVSNPRIISKAGFGAFLSNTTMSGSTLKNLVFRKFLEFHINIANFIGLKIPI